jgi:RNA polymerase sigma-70 factor (ECF subfamily)
MRRHNQRLYRIARAVVRSDAEAEEVVQETYVRAFTHLAAFEGRASVATWLSRIALHTALRARRRWRRHHPRGAATMEIRDARLHTDPPGASIDRADTRTILVAALDALPTRMRAVVMLRLVEGLDTRETSRSLGMTEANVKITLHRARRLMCESIEREAVAGLRDEFAFASERCDRIVEGVFDRLRLHPGDPAEGASTRSTLHPRSPS